MYWLRYVICSNKSMLQLFPINVARKLRRMIPSLCLVKSLSPQTIAFGLSDFQKEPYHVWPISPYITIYHHISPYITIYHHIPMVYSIDMVNFPVLAISEMATQPPELLAAIFVIVHGHFDTLPWVVGRYILQTTKKISRVWDSQPGIYPET